MRFRKTLTFLILGTGLVFALSAGARVGPRRWAEAESVSRRIRPYVACAARALPAGAAFCSGGVPTAERRSETAATAATSTAAKPFTQEQVVSMVRDGFGDESGAKLIEQRGIDFAPAEDFYQSLKAAGASEAFLKALRTAVAPGLSPARIVAPTLRSAHADLKVSATTAASEPASAKKPLNQVQVFALLAGQVPSHRVTMLVQERGIDFEP